MSSVVALFLVATDESISVEARREAAKTDFEQAAQSNRLLFGELLVAIERTNRAAEITELQLLAAQATDSEYHRAAKPKIPKGNLLPYKAIADIVEVTSGRSKKAKATEMAIRREIERRKLIDKFWRRTLAKNQKARMAENAYWKKEAPHFAPEVLLANTKATAAAGRFGDPDRPKNKEMRSSTLAEARKKIAHHKDLQNRIVRHLVMKHEEAASIPPPLKTPKTDDR
jgi:hypothetical protein